VQIVMRENPAIMIYHSETQPGPLIDKSADASVNLFEIRYEMLRRGMFRGLRPPERGPEWRPKEPSSAPPPEPPRFERGRWTLHVRHHAGSLEAVVAQARLRNLVVTGCVLLLIMAAVGALVRYTRRAQRLAELQMEFVAGVSHELRTPLSVMRTAGHNLQGKVASDLSRVQRYGSLIEEECEKLAAIVDQVLRFANVKAGRVIGGKEALAIRTLIAEVLEANRRVIEQSGCKVEQEIPAEVPPVLGDPTTLRHALQNLISNAAKYGKGGNWIGISASTVLNGGEAPLVEIRIADRGPGIPAQEIGHIFDPFFRGRDAVENQIHGTGLGLSLAKRIIEAHHGTIEVESEPGKGTEFLVRIPAASAKDHEFANTAG
jgi:signal transduction histidine kinase